MGLGSLFKGGKYFDKSITPKCDYCQFGKRAKDGNKILCEKKGLVNADYSCGKFSYSPLRRVPVKQLNFVGSLADDELYIETADDLAEQQGDANVKNNQKSAAPATPEAEPKQETEETNRETVETAAE